MSFVSCCWRKDFSNLRGKELVAQLDLWVKKGAIEPDARDAIANMLWQIIRPMFVTLQAQRKVIKVLPLDSKSRERSRKRKEREGEKELTTSIDVHLDILKC